MGEDKKWFKESTINQFFICRSFAVSIKKDEVFVEFAENNWNLISLFEAIFTSQLTNWNARVVHESIF